MNQLKLLATIILSVPLLVWLVVPGGYAAVIYGVEALPSMIRDSEAIVVGEIAEVAEPASGYRAVTVHVLDSWKGAPTIQLKFGISVVRMGCDTSDAKVGETVVLFLGNRRAENQLVIMLEGTGRMRVLGSKEERVVLLTLPVPAELHAQPTRIPGNGMGSGARLSDLKAYVEAVLRSEASK